MQDYDNVVVRGTTDYSHFKNCPHCGADLTEVGVAGMNSVDYTAQPHEEDLYYEDSWNTKFEDFGGASVHCSECYCLLQVTGPYAAEYNMRRIRELLNHDRTTSTEDLLTVITDLVEEVME